MVAIAFFYERFLSEDKAIKPLREHVNSSNTLLKNGGISRRNGNFYGRAF
jgi:hypothetical protein